MASTTHVGSLQARFVLCFSCVFSAAEQVPEKEMKSFYIDKQKLNLH